MTLRRREFLGLAAGMGAALVGAPALVGLSRKTGPRISGGFADDGSTTGHALRDGTARWTSTSTVRVPVVIVGSGIAGLSAAWSSTGAGLVILSCSNWRTAPEATRARGATT